MGKLITLVTAGLGAAAGVAAARRFSPRTSPVEQMAVSPPAEAPPEPATRIAHIARIRAGNEAAVRQLIERFPVTALAAPGIREVNTFVGSSYVISEYGFTGEFGAVFAAWRAHPGVAAYLEELGQVLDDEPAPLPDTPGHQYLASQALHWDSVNGLSFTPRVRARSSEPA